MPTEYKIEDLLDRPLGIYRLVVFLLCGLVMGVEGFDMYMIGAMVPALAQGLDVQPAAIAVVFVAQGVGLALGYTLISPLADRFGRRPIILLCVAAFGLLTLLTTQVSTLMQVAGLRFGAFIFFGGVVPNTISLVVEMVIAARRSRQVVLLNAFFALGAASGSALAPLLVASYGWEGAFWAGGIAPLVMLPFLWFGLPESPYFLVRKARRKPLARVMRAIAPEVAAQATFVTVEPFARRAPIAALFGTGNLANTLLFMVAGGMMMLVGNLVASWAPTFWNMLAGFDMARAAAIFALSSLGAIAWPFIMIFLIRIVGIKRTVILCYLLGAASMLVFVIEPFTQLLATFMAIAFGAFVVGSISGLYALISASYPSDIRASALGLTSGIGRLLAITGPALGGMLLAQGSENHRYRWLPS